MMNRTPKPPLSFLVGKEPPTDAYLEYRSQILGHGQYRRPRYPRPVYTTHEFLFLPPRGLIDVPEDFEAFHDDFFWAFLDQGYRSRCYRHWTLSKLTRREWYQSYRNWSLCADAPKYCITLLQKNGHPADGYAAATTEHQVHDSIGAFTIWIVDRATLRLFFEAFPLIVFPQRDGEEDMNYEVIDNLLDLCRNYSHPPHPRDYLDKFWPLLSIQEQQRFLSEVTGEPTP